MNAGVDREKRALRQRIRQARDAIAPDEAARAAQRAAALAMADPDVSQARTVALYAQVGTELSTLPLARALVTRDVVLAYPRVAGSGLEFFAANPERLVPGYMAIPEPPPDAPPLSLDDIDVLVIPGLAFDAAGGRLGWGKGYYDRTLGSARGLRVGFAFACQVVSEVPRDASDITMDRVITEAGVTKTTAAR